MLQIQCFCILEVMTIVYLRPENPLRSDIVAEVTPFLRPAVSVL